MPDDAGLIDRRPPETATGRRRFTLGNFRKMMDIGVVREGERTELVDGELRVMASEGELHDVVLDRLTDLLAEALGSAFKVRQRSPFNIPPDSQLAPDVSVWPAGVDVRRKTGDQVRLVCEVSRTTQIYDFGEKASLYAQAGVLEYWIIEPEARRLTVFRGAGPEGWREQQPADRTSITPLCAPEVEVEWTRVLDD